MSENDVDVNKRLFEGVDNAFEEEDLTEGKGVSFAAKIPKWVSFIQLMITIALFGYLYANDYTLFLFAVYTFLMKNLETIKETMRKYG